MRLFLFLSIALLSAAFAVPLEVRAAKDDWVQVKSKNFNLIGNASERDIRKVGTKLEQFRESFRLLFSTTTVESRFPINVVVFRNDASYGPFKPRRADGQIDHDIAGYFQSGEDVNYITLSIGGNEKQTFGTIFHEYVHFIISTNFKNEIPQWLNEGLAEYHQTFEITDDRVIRLGFPQESHAGLLKQGGWMPFPQLFAMTNQQLLQTSGRTRDIFYAQSWALVHFLTQRQRSDALDKFLKSTASGAAPATAFQDAFGLSHERLEIELRTYVARNAYNFQQITLKKKLISDADMRASPLSEASVNTHLGELLHQSQRTDEAEPYLLAAIKAEPELGSANAALGKLRLSQRRFEEARVHFEKAIAGSPRDHLSHYRYANLLGREGRDEYGYVRKLAPETVTRMRTALNRAIEIDPTFVDSYELLAFVAMVTNEDLDAGIAHLNTALTYQPGNHKFSFRIAEILTRQSKFDEATAIAEKIVAETRDPDLSSRSKSLLTQIADLKAFAIRNEAEKKAQAARLAAMGDTPLELTRVESPRAPTEEELAKQNDHIRIRAINANLRKTLDGEQRVRGHIQRIDCRKRPLAYTIKTPTETFTLTSKDFDTLYLRAHDPAAMRNQIGCDADLAKFSALVTYKGLQNAKATSRGDLIAVEFVPPDFRFMTADEMRSSTLVIYEIPEPKREKPAEIITLSPITHDIEANRSLIASREINDALRKPADGEKRESGFLEQIECTEQGSVYNLRVGSEIRKLISYEPRDLRIYAFTPDAASTVVGCDVKPIEFPAVFVYKPDSTGKSKLNGEILSIEFVPKSFVLQ